MADHPEFHFPARSLAKGLILIGLVSLALSLVQVEKGAEGNAHVWIGISEVLFGQIFFALCLGEIVIGVLLLVETSAISYLAGCFVLFLGGAWNIAIAVICFVDPNVQLKLFSPLLCLVFGILMIFMSINSVREFVSLQREARRMRERYERLDFRAMMESLVSPEEYAELVNAANRLTQTNELPADYWRKQYENFKSSGAKPYREAKERDPSGVRRIPGFGKLTRSQFAMLELAGYNLDRTRLEADLDSPATEYVPDLDRMSIIKRGRSALMEMTGQDLGYDLAAWRDWLDTHPEHQFGHHYAAMNTRKLVERAHADPDRQRLVAELIRQMKDWSAPG